MNKASLLLRIIKNPLAFSGLSINLVISIMIVGAPFFTRFSPTDQKNWLGAKPPMFSHPDVLSENRFTIGHKPESSIACNHAQTIEIHQLKAKLAELRIVTDRDGYIKSIKLDNESLESINLNDYETITEITSNNFPIREIPKSIVKTDELAPNQLMRENQRVLLLSITLKSEDQKILIQLKENLVDKINITQEEMEQIVIKGANVTKLIVNNKEIKAIHWLGTDELGRDLFSRILYGGRVSLMVGIVATAVSLIIGVIYGAISGYVGGKADSFLMSAIDILYAIPFMFLVIILMVSFGRSLLLLFVALGAVQWLTMARIVRGQILSLKEMEFVEAARMCGSGNLKIIFKHLLPHTLGPIIVYTSLTVPVVILEESFLSFIGLQVQMNGLSLDSWGTLIDNGIKALGQEGERMWLLLYPSLAMLITLFGLNAFGDGLRDILDPKENRRSS